MDITTYIPGISVRITNGVPNFGSFPNWRSKGTGRLKLSDCIRSQTEGIVSTQTTSTIGSYGAGAKWASIVSHPNGKVYVIPFGDSRILEIDTVTDTVSEPFPSLPSSTAFASACLHPNGKIYCIPYNAEYFVSIDVYAKTWRKIADGMITGTSTKYHAGIVGFDDLIYCVPHGNTKFLIFEPNSDAFWEVGPTITANSYMSGTLGNDGKIYLAPWTGNTIGEFDTRTHTLTTYSNSTLAGLTSPRFSSGVIGPDGRMYCIPFSAASMCIFDPVSKQMEFVASSATTEKWLGGCLGPNGKIYGAPYGISSIMEFDTKSKTFSNFGSVGGAGRYGGITLGKSGRLYCAPVNQTAILIVLNKQKEELNDDFFCSRYLNKY